MKKIAYFRKTVVLTMLIGMTFMVNGKNVYLASTGNDSNSGENGSPVATLAKAMELVVSGDSILVEDMITLATRFEFSGATYGGKNVGFRGINPGSGFSGGGASALLKFGSQINVNYVFKDLTFQNGYSTESGQGGPSIMIASSCPEFINCQFINNKATNDGAQGGTIMILNYDRTDKPVKFEQCVFSGNDARKGNVIYIHSGGLNISDCQFSQNVYSGANTSTEAGAIYVDQGDKIVLNIYNSEFSENSTKDRGAAIAIRNSLGSGVVLERRTLDVEINHCSFNQNVLTKNSGFGGAIWINDESSNAYTGANLSITNSSFVGNSIVDGGSAQGAAIAINKWNTPFANTQLTVSGCTFTGNNCKYGAAFSIIEYGKARIENCLFSQNAYDGSAANGEGGGIYVNQKGNVKLDIVSTVFRENYSAKSNKGAAITFKNGNNIAKTLDLNILSCAFVANGSSITSWGGAIFINDGQGTDGTGTYTAANITIANSTFYNNKAQYAGAICFDNWYTAPVGTLLKVVNCTFAKNQGNNGAIVFDKNNSSNMNKQLYNLVVEGNSNFNGTISDVGVSFKADNYNNTTMEKCFINAIQNVAISNFSTENTLGYGNNTVLKALPDNMDYYINKYNCIPVTQTAALGYGDSSYLEELGITVDQLGNERGLVACNPGAVEQNPDDITTGIPGEIEHQPMAYVNMNNQIVVCCNEQNALVSVFNLAGQKLINQYLTGEKTIINKELNAGVYFVKVAAETIKLIIR